MFKKPLKNIKKTVKHPLKGLRTLKQILQKPTLYNKGLVIGTPYGPFSIYRSYNFPKFPVKTTFFKLFKAV